MTSKSVEQKIFNLVTKITGHKTDDLAADLFLESDLGLDSIKTVELLNGMIQLIPQQRQNEFLQVMPMEQLMQLQTLGEMIEIAQDWLIAPNLTDSAAPVVAENSPNVMTTSSLSASKGQSSTEIIEQQIFNLVGQITGHHPADLAPDLFLESDLGLDSIKTVELLNGMIQLIPQQRQNEFLQVVPMEQLMQLQTLGEMIEIAQDWLIDLEYNQQKATDSVDQNSDKKTLFVDLSEETVDITDSQYIFLATHWAVSTCSVCSTVRVRGSFEPTIAQQSWQELLLRHPMLRAYFFIPQDATRFSAYQLRVGNQTQLPEMEIIDLRKYDETTQKSLICKEVNRRINERWNIEKWPLHIFFVIHLNDSVYELGLHHHHVLSDGLSNQIILREFLEIYGARLAGTEPILPPSTSVEDYRQLIQSLNQWQDPQAEELLKQYLAKQSKDKFVWNPQQKTNSGLETQIHSLRYQVSSEIVSKLIQKAHELRLSFNSLLVGAYLQAIAHCSPIPDAPIINIPTGGRIYPDADATNVIGCFAQNLALSFPSIKNQSDWTTLLQSIQAEIQSGLAANYDKAQTRQMGLTLRDKVMLAQGKLPSFAVNLMQNSIKSNLFLSNMGQTHIKPRYAAVEVLDYRSATVTNAGCIDTLTEIFNGCLYINTSYDINCFSDTFINYLIEQFILQLEDLANLEIKFQQKAIKQFHLNQEFVTTMATLVSEIFHLTLTEKDWHRDLESELGMDSLEHIRLVTKLEQELGQRLDRQKLLSCRSLAEIAQAISPATSPVLEATNSLAIPYIAIARQAQQTPQALAILGENQSLTYQQLHTLSNQLAHYLRRQGVKPGALVGIMTHRNPLMWIGILGILKAGGAYVPIDPTYPQDRIGYMLGHAEIDILLTESQLTDKLTECVQIDSPLHSLVFLDEGTRFKGNKVLKQVNQDIWFQESVEDLTLVNTPDDFMVVLYTSGSTGRPKGVMLNHRGYMNRLEWMQKTFALAPSDRVAQKTSICFDISIWEIFWPLMYGATACPLAKTTVKNPWQLAEWINEARINVMHFVPSLFGEFINALEGEGFTFPHLRWLFFSGEALPIPFIHKWLDQYGNSTGLANLYGPTEASIDVSAHIIRQHPGQKGETSIPIGKAIDNVDLLILDDNRQPLPPGKMGELWIGGVQLAKGYLKDPERTAKAFCSNPFPHIQGKTLYRTGDLAKQLPDGSIEYHGRIDHQVKIRGFRIELGEIETVLLSHPSVQEAGVVVLDYGEGQKRLVAGLAGSVVDVQEMKNYLARQLTDYMIPHRIEWLPSLPKNHNGKLDRKALLAYFQGKPAQTSDKISSPTKAKSVSLERLPLGPAQRWLVRYFEAPYQWTGYSRCLYHQPLDLSLFNQALNYLIERHWALRTIFIQEDGQWWQQEIHHQNALKAIFYDGSHLSTEERNLEIHQKIKAIGQEFRINQWPLVQALVVKVNDTCYDINTIGHHIIGDLLSNQILFREFWLIYTQLLSGKTNPLDTFPQTSSYADYVRLLMEEEEQGHLESHLDYWQAQFPTAKSTFQIPLDKQLGANLETSAASEWFNLSPDETKHLLTHAKKHYDCNVYSLLLAPLYRLMANWSQRHDVILSHRIHSRNLGKQKHFFDSIGNFATNFPLGLTIETDQSWQDLLQQIKDKFEAVPMNGGTFDWLGERLPSFMYPDNHLTPVRANYLGNRDIKPSSLFEFMKEDWDRRLSPPEQKRTTLLEFFFSVVDNRLELQLEYSEHFHSATTIQQLGQQYISLLQSLLAEVPQPKINQSPAPDAPQPINLSSLPLAGQVAIVTGGGRGIGQAIALKLAQQGAKVAVLARHQDQLQETVNQIQQWGGQAIAIPTDISELNQVEAAIAQIVEQWQGIDILVNNAGITGFATLANSDPVKWRKTVEVNLFGTYYCCRTVVPYLLRRGKGKIINLGSDSSVIGYPLFSAYAASKHGVAGLTKSLAEELKQQNIQVNAVCPAFVDTDLTPKAYRDSSIPTHQIAEIVAFLASPHVDSITGECLKVFGKQDMFFYGSKNMLEPFTPVNRCAKSQVTNSKVQSSVIKEFTL
ncbi:amino acid adenylation domain-containing protein [Coleofasciculus chthonoplastes]|uniref:amino acid adenylation domain-containing protein n=1 Tax=Coleofasciculus chthonoplastes TaxID=64178 RepID=UPI0032F2E0C8